MNIRPVTPSDVSQIIKLIGGVWAEYDCVLDTGAEEQYLLAPGEYFRARDGEFWVAEENGEIVATAALQMLSKTTAELKSLYVAAEFRKHGLGRQLTEMAIDLAREKGAMEMILWTDTRFTKAHRLYERLGFILAGQRELRDINKTTELGFRKDLSLIAENSFADAVKKFQNFLAANDLPAELLWVFEEDAFSRAHDRADNFFWLKLPLLYENDDLAEKIYEQGRKKGFGIAIAAYAVCDGQVCCGLIISGNKTDDRHLKFSFTKEMPEAAPIKSAVKWKMFGLFPRKYKPGNFFAYLPSKKDLQFPGD